MADTPSTPPAPSNGRLLSLLFVGVLMAALDIAIVGPALPALRAHFRADDRAMSWIFSAYVLANLVGMPLMAKLSDRYGRRAVYVADVALFGAGSLVVAFAPSFAALILGRAIQGLGAGGIFPVASAVIGDTVAVERRGRALGMLGAVWGIAFIIGPMLGGVLLLMGWEWLFLINVPVALLVIIASLRIVPGPTTQASRPFDVAGLLVLCSALGAFVWGVSELDVRAGGNLADPVPWIAIALAVALVPLFVFIERRATDPVIRPSLFRSSQVAIAAALSVGAGVGEAAVVFIPALMVVALGVSSARASFMLLPLVVAMAISSPLFGRLLDRVGSRVVLSSGALLTSVGCALLGLVSLTNTSFYIVSCLFGLGLSALLGGAIRYVMLGEARPDERAATQGILAVFMAVGQLAGTAITAAVAGSSGGSMQAYGHAFIVIGAILGVLAVVALGLHGRARERATLLKQSQPAAA